MQRCPMCNSVILFRGFWKHDIRFCSSQCYESRFLSSIVREHQSLIEVLVANMHESACPMCNGPGPIDVRLSYWVWTFIFYAEWSTRSHVSCLRCGNSTKWLAIVYSLVLGGWSPIGIFFVPLQVGKNLVSLCNSQKNESPSKQLTQRIELAVATTLAEEGYRPTILTQKSIW